MSKILIIEDDEVLAGLIRDWLANESDSVDMVHDGAEGIGALKLRNYDLVVLDWELPGMYGIDVLKEYRRWGGKTRVLFLTGRAGLSDKEYGLDSGADDYLTKPFQSRELCARVRALLRRETSNTSSLLKVGDLELDAERYSVRKGSEELSLQPKEFALLQYFMRYPSRVFTTDQLLNSVWPTDSTATAEALTTCIKRLRKKIDSDGAPSIIQTVYGVGYKLQAQ